MHSRTTRVLLVCLICCAPCLAAQVEITVTTPNGTPLKNALVIVQDLRQQERELFRALSDDHGNISPHSLEPGLYRAIGAYPYGPWRTSVREFLVRDAPVKVQLRLAARETSDTVNVSIGRLTVHVLDANGQPARGARVLVRDAEADPDSEHWGTTDAQGTTNLELTMNPAVLVVVYHDQMYTFPADSYQTERTLRLK